AATARDAGGRAARPQDRPGFLRIRNRLAAQHVPDVVDYLCDPRQTDRRREVERAGIEDLRTRRALVEGHLGVARADRLRNPRQDDGPRWRARRALVDLHAGVTKHRAVDEARSLEDPPLDPRSPLDHVRLLRLARVARDPLRADEGCFRPAEPAPHLDPADLLALARDLPEEVVGGEEHQVPAEVAVPLHDVVHVTG